MPDFRSLLKVRGPLLLAGAHDALTARMIENAGFTAYGIGGAARGWSAVCSTGHFDDLVKGFTGSPKDVIRDPFPWMRPGATEVPVERLGSMTQDEALNAFGANEPDGERIGTIVIGRGHGQSNHYASARIEVCR